MTSNEWQVSDPSAAEALDDLQAELRRVLDHRLFGLYLYGSLVTGDFDPERSDIDLLAVTATTLTEDEFEALRVMHDAFVESHESWNDRIEVVYVSEQDLRQFRTASPAFPVISPGEPFHLRKEPLADWTANWFLIREASVALIGPPAHLTVPEVSADEFRESLRRYVGELQERVELPRSSGSESYAILTACRALHWYETGLQTSTSSGSLDAGGTSRVVVSRSSGTDLAAR
jgi:predicted nucleotidyltransferase